MNIFVAVGIVLILLCFIVNKKNKRVVSIFSFLLFFIVLVGHTGEFVNNGDYPSYLALFMGKTSWVLGTLDGMIADIWTGDNTEPFFYLYQKALAFFLPSTNWAYILAYGTTVSIPIFVMCNKRKDSAPFALCILLLGFGGFFLLNILCAQRQMLGICYLLIAISLLLYHNYKFYSPVIIILFILALLCHKSFLIIIPLLVLAHIVRFKSKAVVFIALFISLALAMLSKFSSLAESLSDTLNLISASSGIVSEDIEHFANLTRDSTLSTSILGLMPLNILGFASVFFYKKEEINGFGAKCLICAMILYNVLSSVWLVDRLTLLLFIVGITIGLPQSISGKPICKLSFLMILIGYLLFNALRVYPGGYQLLPYPSIL